MTPAPAESVRRILLLDQGDPAIAETMRSSLCTRADVDLARTVPDGDGLPWDLVIAHYDTVTHPDWCRALHRFDALHRRGRLVVCLDTARPPRTVSARLFSEHQVTNFLAINGRVDTDELLVTVEKILSGDIFGIDKHFSWFGCRRDLRLSSSAEKRDVLDAVVAFAGRLAIPSRLVDQLAASTDELVSNALFNAPVDTDGRHRNAHLPRTESVALAPGEGIDVSVRCDGRRLGVSVADPFGTLSPDVLTSCLGQQIGQIRPERTSGGVGLFSLLSMVSHLVVNLAPGYRTEVIGLIDIRGTTYRDFLDRGFSFNLFLAPGR